MHKDLSDEERDELADNIERIVSSLFHSGESLAIARECLINAFDRAAEALDAQ